MIHRAQVSAVLVTRGDVDLEPVLGSLEGFGEVLVWDNSKREDLKVFGRYQAAFEARNEVVYVQDDDCIVQTEGILANHEPGKVTCNMPTAKRAEYSGLGCGHIALVGWGACFERGLIHKMQPYIDRHGVDDLFLRECDRVFTAVNQIKLIEAPFSHLPHAFAGRMGNEARHLPDMVSIRGRIAAL